MEDVPAASPQVIDYRIRPNKSAERRMFSEAFRRLSFFEPLEHYRYVGFGSTTFSDFHLFHRALNITEMISIENRVACQARFRFNRPFHCIELKFGDSGDVLPQLTWDKRAIVWLDYEGKLTGDKLQDVSSVASQARSGSMLVVTVNGGGYLPDRSLRPEQAEAWAIDLVRKDLQPFDLVGQVKLKDLQKTLLKDSQGRGISETYHRQILAAIRQILLDRNGMASRNRRMEYHPLFKIAYRDGAEMVSVGGILIEEGDRATLRKCQFGHLPFVRSEKQDFFRIKVPAMTPRERSFLDRRLPSGNCAEAERIGLSTEEIANYIDLYRYCPSFAEIELP